MKFYIFIKNTHTHTHTGSGSLTRSAKSPRTELCALPISSTSAYSSWLVLLTFPTPHKGEKSPSILSQKLCWVFGNLLLNNRDPNTFIFCFQLPCLFFLHFSPILSFLPQSIIFGLTAFSFLEFVSLPWHRRGCLTGNRSPAPPALVLGSKNNSLPWLHLQVPIKSSKWQDSGNIPCKVVLTNKTLLSSFALWALQEADTGDFSYKDILHMPFYSNTKK